VVVCGFNRGDGLFVYATLLLMHKFSLILLFLLAIPFVADAQCSMCKAVAESANDGGFGAGLNYGIMYLMLFPYLIISGIAYRLYRAKKAAK
jgi:hypothetical protein